MFPFATRNIALTSRDVMHLHGDDESNKNLPTALLYNVGDVKKEQREKNANCAL